jgi:1,4-alpha-glucan branching enzyme
MIYAYRERFIMALDGKNTKDLWNRIPGDEEDRFNTLKAAIAYIGFLPGKLMSSLLYPEKQGKYMEAMVQEINTMNHQYAALEKEDENSEAFCWVNCLQNNDCTVSFLRKTDDPEDTLLVIANFANAAREEFTIGVPEEGKYRLLFSTQEKAYGGNVSSEKPLLYAAEESWDGFPFNITTALEPLSVAVYGFVPYTEQEIFDLAEKKAEAIRLQLEEEARQKAARLKKSSLKEKLAKQVEDAEEEIAKGSEAKPKLERKQKGKKSR